MLNCKQSSQYISQSLDRPLPMSTRVQLSFHLLICRACSQFNAQLGQLRVALQRMRHTTENDQSIELSADAKAKIADFVESNNH